MNITPWRNKRRDADGNTGLARFGETVDHMIERLWRDPFGAAIPSDFRDEFVWGPALDLSETDNEITARLELPGMKPDDIDIRVAGQVLTVRGQKREEREDRRRGVQYSERHFGQFSRTVTLPTRVDADKIDATYRDGILTIILKKESGAQPRRITVKSDATAGGGRSNRG